MRRVGTRLLTLVVAKRLKDHVYRAGYEHGLKLAAIPYDSELFTIIILCSALTRFDPNSNEKEDDDEGEEDNDEGCADSGDGNQQ